MGRYDKKEVVDNINVHVSSVGKYLAKKFSTNNANYLKYLTEVNKEVIAF